jgi:predicted alpha/beta-fold hydrolase
MWNVTDNMQHMKQNNIDHRYTIQTLNFRNKEDFWRVCLLYILLECLAGV